ncbi:glycine betaine ABC transporter substrate-binding protein [Desulfococcaceae bacterium HSG7]|nr:glycine betaine ABC transporter substrate-binding protein [Desulfococcaceae bacterium HSG7]
MHWTPDWSHAEIKPGVDAVWLDVPYSAWHIDPKLDTTQPDGSNTGFPTGCIKTFVNTKWANENPAAVKLMEVLTVPAQDCSKAIYITRQKGEKFEIYFGLAEEWIAKNRDQMDAWLKEARAAATE